MKNSAIPALSKSQLKEIDDFIERNRRTVVAYYYEAEDVEQKYVPVDGGEIRIFHHKPETPEFKFPIVFLPGFGTPPWTWRHFSLPLHGKGEYVIIDSREKRSSNIIKKRKVDFTNQQMARDLRDVINFLGYNKKEYILNAGCWGGGVVLEAIIKQYLNPKAVVLHDPYPKFVHKKFLARMLFGLTPGFMLDFIKNILAFIILAGMKNKAQKERNKVIVNEAVGWKWRRTILQNLKFDLYPDFPTITKEILLFHGPKDRYHSREIYFSLAHKIPSARFFFMDCADEKRELLFASIAKEFAANTNGESIPPLLKKFEIPIKREEKE